MQRKSNVRFMVQLALLLAIEVLLALTPLGYILIGAVDITILHIPVLIAAITLGPMAGLIMGGCFGITSIITATIKFTPTGFMFSPFLTNGNLYSVVLAMVPRLLFGLITALLFTALHSKAKLDQRVSAGIAAGIGTICHTVMVMGGMALFFGPSVQELFGLEGSVVFLALLGLVAFNGTLEVILGIIVCMALVKPLRLQTLSLAM